jgi:hypothetical protein
LAEKPASNPDAKQGAALSAYREPIYAAFVFLSAWFANFFQFIHLASWHVWGWIADFGYRPSKALLFIVPSIFLFQAIFWYWFGIIGYKPQNKTRIYPISILFVFDRLIPIYNIRQDHYQIETFYQKARAGASTLTTMPYLWWKISVVEVTGKRRDRAEVFLDFMKGLGVGLGIFVVATLSALVVK